VATTLLGSNYFMPSEDVKALAEMVSQHSDALPSGYVESPLLRGRGQWTYTYIIIGLCEGKATIRCHVVTFECCFNGEQAAHLLTEVIVAGVSATPTAS
jgi:hypothetical protein